MINTDIHNFIRSKYEEHKKTGKSSIKFPDTKYDDETKRRIIEQKVTEKYPLDNDNFYSCGCKIKPVLINESLYSLTTYCNWLNDNVKNYCLDCWLKDRKVPMKEKITNVENKLSQLKYCIFKKFIKMEDM